MCELMKLVPKPNEQVTFLRKTFQEIQISEALVS